MCCPSVPPGPGSTARDRIVARDRLLWPWRAQALELLHVYVDLVAGHSPARAAQRYPGVTAPLRACGSCGEDFDGLLAAVGSSAN